MVRSLVSTDVVFTVAEVAKLLKVSVAKVYTMVDRGELEHFRIGTVLRVRRETLEVFAENTEESDERSMGQQATSSLRARSHNESARASARRSAPS